MGTTNDTENRIQQDCFMWIWNAYPALRGLYFEIHNNAFSARAGMKHKAIGRIPGVADNCLLLPNGGLSCAGTAVFFEFKTEKGKQSKVQKDWQQTIEKQGYQYFIIRSLAEFKTVVRGLLS